MFQRPSSPSNKEPSTTAFSNKSKPRMAELFQHHCVSFLYLKREKSWKDIGEGQTKFSFDQDTSSIVIQRGDAVYHRVNVSTRIQEQVSSSQSWVFRAVHCITGSHDVLCLQLPNEPSSFVMKYESTRLKCLSSLESVKNGPSNNSISGGIISRKNSTQSVASVASLSSLEGSDRENNGCGFDLSNGFRSLVLKSTEPKAGSTSAETLLMRRRLSASGTDFSIDGYAPGARHEELSVKSPVQHSPMKPTESGTAKTLRPKPRPVPTLLSFSGMSVKGIAPYNPDKQNQDALVMHQLPTGEIMLSVFDGHGEEGRTVSSHFKTRVPQLLANSTAFNEPLSTGEAIKEALDCAEREIVDDIDVDTTLSGSTGVVGIIRGAKLFMANVGDSRAVFGVDGENGKILARDVTLDHKPDLPNEKKRIQEIGGRVFAVRFDDGIDGPARVWLSYADLPGLAMSRSLGDTIAKEAGVISQPDLFEVDLTVQHKFLIIATDGLWEFMSSQEVVDIVSKYANSENPDAESAIEELIDVSARRWRQNEPVVDDTSIIVAFFM